MTQFSLSGLAALALVTVGGAWALRQLAIKDAIREARDRTEVIANRIIEPKLENGIVESDPDAVRRLDAVVRGIRLDPVVRVKIWRRDGTIVYSDATSLIGENFGFAEDRHAVLASGKATAELSDLSERENRLERRYGKLLEVYVPVETRDGKKLVFETYLRFSSVVAGGRETWLGLGPAFLAALVLLALLQVPLAWSMARRLQEGQRERESLLLQAIEASDAERRRIAGDLHDGLVQDLAGISFELAAAAERAHAEPRSRVADTLRKAAAGTRESMRRLRSLLVEIYPPNLHASGIEAAVADLLAPFAANGVDTSLDVPPGLRLPPQVEELLFRATQEALRNVQSHADARSVGVQVSTDADRVALVVRDDGRGFSPEEATGRREKGHLGLALLSDLADRVGGRFDVQSQPGAGTRVFLEVPVT